jgi:Tfp pilus assembly protein PilF
LIQPDLGHLYNNLGVSYTLAGKNEKAVDAFLQALDKQYTQNKVYNNLGLVLAKLGKYDKALEWFTKGGSEAKAYNNLGCIYLKHGATKKADDCFQTAIELDPSFYDLASKNKSKVQMSHQTTE